MEVRITMRVGKFALIPDALVERVNQETFSRKKRNFHLFFYNNLSSNKITKVTN